MTDQTPTNTARAAVERVMKAMGCNVDSDSPEGPCCAEPAACHGHGLIWFCTEHDWHEDDNSEGVCGYALMVARAAREAHTNTARGGNTDNTHRAAVEVVRWIRTDLDLLADTLRNESDGQHVEGCDGQPDCLACIEFDVRRIANLTLDAAPAPTDNDCHCQPCPGRGNDGHGLTHCAECCMGTGVDAEPDCPTHGYPPFNAPTDNQHNNTLELLAADWRLLRYHHPVGANPPVGQLDGDCSCGQGAWPCRDVLRAVVDGPTTPE